MDSSSQDRRKESWVSCKWRLQRWGGERPKRAIFSFSVPVPCCPFSVHHDWLWLLTDWLSDWLKVDLELLTYLLLTNYPSTYQYRIGLVRVTGWKGRKVCQAKKCWFRRPSASNQCFMIFFLFLSFLFFLFFTFFAHPTLPMLSISRTGADHSS